MRGVNDLYNSFSSVKQGVFILKTERLASMAQLISY